MLTNYARILCMPMVAATLALGASPRPCSADELAIKTGQKLAFLGDSITQQGTGTPSGYVQLVISGLKTNGIDVTPIPAGISGHTSRDMLARINRDVIEKKPDWMTMSCGVNDVWHGASGVDLPTYKKNITEMVDRAQTAGIKVMILTSTMIMEDQANPNNQKLIAYNDFLRELAKQKGCLLADLNADMQAAVIADGGGKAGSMNMLTVDGVHMLPPGNRMMALGILKAFGLTDAQLDKAKETWLDIPLAVELNGKQMVTLRQWDQLAVFAAKQHKSVRELMDEAFKEAVNSVIAASGGASNQK